MSAMLETDSANSLREKTVNGSDSATDPVAKKKPVPPPVLPKSFRKTAMHNQKEDNSNKVLICVTTEKETSLETKCKQMEMELKAVKQERDMFQQDATRLKAVIQEAQKEMKKVNNKLDHYNMVSKSKKVQGSLKCWNQSQPCVSDLSIPMPHDELADPQELIKQFIESERLYLNCLEAVDYHFFQPMKMFSIFKCDILSTQQFQALFLNSPQLLIIHRLFYQHLAQLRYLPKPARLEEFVITIEQFSPSFSLYAGFQSEHYMVNLQRELSQCQSKPQFGLLLDNLNKRCEGRTLVDLLRIIAGRLSEYQTLLSGFLEDRLKGTRGMKEGIIRRLEAIKRFLDTVQLDLMQDKDWWDCIVEKMKVLNRVSTSSAIPMDIFHPDTRLIKQGSVNLVVKGKELQKHLYLFTSHVAVGDKLSDQRVQFSEDAMKSLAGASVFSTIDTAGQVIEPDFHSGLREDMLGFRINLSQDSLVVRVGKPNEKKSWIESIEKTIQMIQSTKEPELCEVIIPDEAPKIAAASLEKLFQQLTNPQIPCKEEFIEVFLNTYPCFTTPKDVLISLLKCIQNPDKEKTSQPLQVSANDVFTFNMEDGVDTESSISASNSMQNMSSDYDTDGSLSDSPVMSRRGMHCTSTPSRRLSKSRGKMNSVREGSRTSAITTDSDSSPYTSGVPIADNINREVEMGWDEAEMNSIMHQNGRTAVNRSSQKGSMTSISLENTLFPSYQSRSSNYSQESCYTRDSDDDDDEVDSSSSHINSLQPNLTSLKAHSRSVDTLFLDTDSVFQRVHDSLKDTCEDLVKSQDSKDFLVVNYPSSSNHDISSQERFHKQKEISKEMDEANRLCEEMLSGLQSVPDAKSLDEDDDCFSHDIDEKNLQRYSRRTRRSTETPTPNTTSNRLSITSTNLSFSEPDLVVLSLKSDSVPMNPQYTGGRNDENDELLTSLPATILRKFTEPDAPQHLRIEKHKGGKFRFKSKKNKQSDDRERKSEPASLPDRRHTLNPSSSLYFNSSTEAKEHRQSPSRGLTSIFKKKDKESKKLKKTPSMHGDYPDHGTIPETPKRKRTTRSTSLAPSIERHVYMNIDEFGEPKQNVKNRNEDGSPKLGRSPTSKIAFKNFTLASKVFLILGRWIETHFEDFQDDQEVMEMLNDFLQSMLASESAESKLAEQLFAVVNRFKQQRQRSQHTNLEAIASTFSKIDSTSNEEWGKPSRVLGNQSIDLGKSSNLKEPGFVKAFAEQLTLIEYSCYHQVTRRELLNCNWKKKDKEVYSPNVCRLIKQTNEMTSWICTEVLMQDSPASRATVLEHFICTAMKCYKHYDMHCALSIAVALSSTPIKRLTKTWDAVDKKTKHKYEKLKDICDPQEKCKKLREKLERVTANEIEKNNRIPSCLPYLGAYLDLIYCLDIGIKTYNAEGLVNFAKMTKLSLLIDTFLQYQRTPYTFEPKQDVVAYIMSAKRLSDNELYDLSVAKEPSRR